MAAMNASDKFGELGQVLAIAPRFPLATTFNQCVGTSTASSNFPGIHLCAVIQACSWLTRCVVRRR
jgi:hypothetical protein